MFELLVNDRLHSGFQSGSLMRSMAAPASNFDAVYSATATELPSWPIEEGDAFELRIDGETVVTGFIDRPAPGYDARTRWYKASGRSKTADLVDSSCVFTPRTWLNKDLASIARDVAAGFACDTEVYGDEGRRFARHKYQAGENAIEVIRRAASLRGMHLFDSPSGNLVIARVGADSTGVTLGPSGTVLRGERLGDWSRRFSSYRFMGQSHARDDLTGTAGTQLHGEAVDPTLQARGRFRPTVVPKRGGGGRQDLGAAAIMARNKAAGESETVSYKVKGFHITRGVNAGRLWNPGELVDVDDEVLRVRGRMVIMSASMRFGARVPRETDLVLAWPEAFDEVDFPTRGRGDVWQ